MAKVNFGLVVTEARGKAGEVVYSRNKGGAYVRHVPTYTQPLTPDVITIRAIMSTVGAMWYNTLTEAQRTAWRAFGTNARWHDIIGNINVPSGSAIFSQCNLNNANLAGPFILDPPPNLTATDPGALTASASGSAGTLTLTPTVPLPAGYAPLVMATTPMNPGWQFFNKFLRQLRGTPDAPWADTFPATTPTPPWLAAPNHVPTNWTESSNTLTLAAGTQLDDIYSHWGATDLTIQATMTWQLGASPAPGLTARVDPTSGSRYLFYLSGNPGAIYLYWSSNWSLSGTLIRLGAALLSPGTTPHTITWTFSGAIQTLSVDGTPLISATDYNRANGAVGIVNLALQTTVQNYSATQTTQAPITLPNIGPQYIQKFGPLTPGKKIGLSLAYVNFSNGAKSPTQTTSCIIGA